MKKILFVDDDLNLLQAFGRLLRGMRREWAMEFVSSGEVAKMRLQERQFDIVVSDMRMPVTDGAAVLAAAKRRNPGAARILLSGFAQHEALMRAVPFAQQFIAKPCPEGLRDALRDTLQVQDVLPDPEMRAMVGRFELLPVRPDVLADLSGVLSHPESTVKDILPVVERDIALCGEVLRLVNSGFFSRPRRVSSIDVALGFLGIARLRELRPARAAAQCERRDALSPAASGAEKNSGVIAARLVSAMLESRVDIQHAFAAALVHDVGRLILQQCRPEELKQASELAQRRAISLIDAERELLGVTHPQIGAYVAGLWGLPGPIVQSIAFHHDPMSVPHDSFGVLDAVHIAVHLADRVVGNGGSGEELDAGYLAMLGVTDRVSQWRELASTVQHGAV